LIIIFELNDKIGIHKMNRQKYFYEEFIICLGLVSGLLLAIGIDPEAVIYDSILSLIKTSDLIFGFIFYVIPLIGTVVSMLEAYNIGGKIGIIGVVVAFFGGLIILPPYSVVGVLLVLLGRWLGKLGVNRVISDKDYV